MREGIPESYDYSWHDKRCCVLIKAPFLKGVKRNCLIETTIGDRFVVQWRAIRRYKQK